MTGSVFDVGELLYKIKEEHLYTASFTTFKDFLLSCEPKLSESKGQYLRKIVEITTVLNIPRSIYEPVGIAKLRVISRLDPKKSWTNPLTGETLPMAGFIVNLIENGQKMHLSQIKEHVRTLLGQVGENALVRRQFTVTEQVAAEVIDPAVELARRQLGSTHKDDDGISQDASDGRCWEMIAVSFLNDPANEVLANG